MQKHRWLAALLLAITFQLLVGCASGQGPDPWEKNNRAMYEFNENLDRVLLKPVSDAYTKFVPGMVRTGVNNGFANMAYFDVIVNDFLQGKWDQGCRDAARMAINSSIGCLGWFDPATQMGLKEHDTDFGVTLGKWGVPQAPYMVLPLLGPSTAREICSIPVGMATNPLTYYQVSSWIALPLDALGIVNARADAERYLKFRNDNAIDPYVFTREAYLQYRQNKVTEGRNPVDQSMYEDPDAPATTAPAATEPTTIPAK